MSLTVRSATMKTLRSTLVTTTVLLGGLVVSSHLLYPSDAASDAADRAAQGARIHAIAAQTRAAEAKSSVPGWIDPPARAEARADDQPVKTAWTAAPAPDVVEPASAARSVSVRTDHRHPAAANGAKRAEQGRRKRMAQAARTKQAKAKETVANTEVASRAEPAPSPRVDPIGDLLHGLGIGRES